MPVKNSSFIFISRTGCLLPLLIISNLFFGWLIFKPGQWLLIEGFLVLFFIINSFIFTRYVSSLSSNKHSKIIDVDVEVVEDNQTGGKKDRGKRLTKK